MPSDGVPDGSTNVLLPAGAKIASDRPAWVPPGMTVDQALAALSSRPPPLALPGVPGMPQTLAEAGQAAGGPVSSSLRPWTTSPRPDSGPAMPDFGAIQANLLAPTGVLTPAAAAAAIAPGGTAAQAPPSPIAMLSLLASGTHKFIPVHYDPFAAEMPQAPNAGAISGAAPSITESVRAPAPLYTARTGMRQAYLSSTKKGAGAVGGATADPEIANVLSGIT